MPFPSVGAVRVAAHPQQRSERHHVGLVREPSAHPAPYSRARTARVPDFLVQGPRRHRLSFPFSSSFRLLPFQSQWGDFELLSLTGFADVPTSLLIPSKDTVPAG